MSPDLKVHERKPHESKVLGLLILPAFSKEIEIKPTLKLSYGGLIRSHFFSV